MTTDPDDLPRGNCFGSDDPDLFFSNDFQDQVAAALICKTCPLKKDCADVALERGEWGVWGATTEEDRKRLAKKRAEKATKERRTRCFSGAHEMTPENTSENRNGRRECRECNRARRRAAYAANREAS